MALRVVGDDERPQPQFETPEEAHAFFLGQLQGAVDERARSATIGRPGRKGGSHRFVRPRTRRRWLPPILTAMASGALTLAIVNFTNINGGGGDVPPVDNHPSISVVNGFGQPIPAPAPSLANSSSKTTKTPAAPDGTTGETVVEGVQGMAQDARRSTGSDGPSVTTGSKSGGATSGSTSGSSGSGKESGSKPAATSQPSSPSDDSGGGGSTSAPPVSEPTAAPTPAPTQDGPVRTLLTGVGTVVGDLGDTVDGTLDDVGGPLGGGQG